MRPIVFLVVIGLAAQVRLGGETTTPPAPAPAHASWLAEAAVPAPFVARGEDNVRYLELEINGKPALGMMDTGADSCWILKSRAEALGTPKALSLVRKATWRPIVTVQKRSAASSLGLILGDFPSLENDNRPGRKPIDLVCGQAFFQSFPGVLDFGRNCYWVYRKPESAKELQAKLAASDWVVMPLEKFDHYHLFQARVGGEPMRFLADTGTGHTLIQESLATQLGFAIDRIGGQMIGLGEQNGILSSCIARNVDFGPAQFPKLPVIVSDQVSILGKNFAGGPPVRGILGAEIMRAAGMIYDPVNAWLAWPNAPFDPLAFGEVNPLGGASREKLPAQVKEATDIVMTQVTAIRITPSAQGAAKTYATVDMTVLHIVKGAYQERDTISLRLSVTPAPDLEKQLEVEYRSRGGRRIVLLKREGKSTPALVSWFDYWSDRYMLIKQLQAAPAAK